MVDRAEVRSAPCRSTYQASEDADTEGKCRRRRQLRLTPELDVEPEFGSSDDDSVGGLVSLIARPTAADMKKSVVTEASSSHQKKRMKPMRK